jgi:hypothetical protein
LTPLVAAEIDVVHDLHIRRAIERDDDRLPVVDINLVMEELNFDVSRRTLLKGALSCFTLLN